jgi:Cytochrome P460
MKFGILWLAAVSTALMAQAPEYKADGSLMRPANYREWIYLSSGLGMTYGAKSNSEPSFDNVFVSPASYREFQKTGRWPEKTMFVLEVRGASSHGSINRGGHFQTDLIAIEAEVKDSARFPDKWAFFGFGDKPGSLGATARRIPPGSVCNVCHAKNAAVDNTFVQFYPTLIEAARKNGTLKATDEAPAPTSEK